jgi:hypothetical protein
VEIVAVRALWNLLRTTAFNSMAATRSIKSSYFNLISTDFNKSENLVRDQGVGSSAIPVPTQDLGMTKRLGASPTSRTFHAPTSFHSIANFARKSWRGDGISLSRCILAQCGCP